MKLKHLFLFLISIICSLQFCFGQVTFQKKYSSAQLRYGPSAAICNDGGYIVATNALDTVQNFDGIYIIKLDSIGDTIWTRSITSYYDTHVGEIKQTSDNGYIIAGSTVPSGAGGNVTDIFVIKTDSTGNISWRKNIGEVAYDGGSSVTQTPDGGYAIVGSSNSFAIMHPDIYLVRIDSSGNFLWARVFGTQDTDNGFKIKATSDGGFIITGLSYGILATSGVPYLMKCNSSGYKLWAKYFPNLETANSVIETSDGGYMVTGKAEITTIGTGRFYILKTDNSGNMLWYKIYDSPVSIEAYGIQQSADGGFVLVGDLFNAIPNTNCFLLRTDSTGNAMWSTTFGGQESETATSVFLTPDKGYFLSGYSHLAGSPNYNIFLIKTDSTGYGGCNNDSLSLTPSLLTATAITAPFFDNNASGHNQTPNIIMGNVYFVSTTCIPVNIQEHENMIVSTLTPNPNNGNFTITFPSTINQGIIEIYNTTGAKLYSQNIANANTANVKLNNFAKGIYFVKASDDKKQFCHKFILQ